MCLIFYGAQFPAHHSEQVLCPPKTQKMSQTCRKWNGHQLLFESCLSAFYFVIFVAVEDAVMVFFWKNLLIKNTVPAKTYIFIISSWTESSTLLPFLLTDKADRVLLSPFPKVGSYESHEQSYSLLRFSLFFWLLIHILRTKSLNTAKQLISLTAQFKYLMVP